MCLEPTKKTVILTMAETEQQSGSTPEDEAHEVTDSVTFMVPKKEISMVPDMGKWKRSQAYADYMGFVLTLNEGVKGKKLTSEYKVSEVCSLSYQSLLKACAGSLYICLLLRLKKMKNNNTPMSHIILKEKHLILI
ncbi:serine/threonine-protein phosphatase 2A activator [Anarrhichthys ocellatus]|uniref:serine/threonine-protein phosphatase 2A activator n=1 Tax=Anarrhichthys ocellatus TaxID=433405 RepID=UPI0012EE2069|nr:serine/threonine-protein phosphatase 2A activator [Anarrhichthys ocellatus]